MTGTCLAQDHHESRVALPSHETGPGLRTGHKAKPFPSGHPASTLWISPEKPAADQALSTDNRKYSNILFCLLLKIHKKPKKGQLFFISLKWCSFEFVARKKYAKHKKNIATWPEFLNLILIFKSEWEICGARKLSSPWGNQSAFSRTRFSLLAGHHNHCFMHRKLQSVLNIAVLSAVNTSRRLGTSAG